MLNKDKRSITLSFLLGDGCMHYTSAKNKKGQPSSGCITIAHGNAQADYNAWKAKMLGFIYNRDIKIRPFNKGTATQISICVKRFKAWRKFCYPNGKKDLPTVLKFIRHPEFALAIWLMDDGYVEPSLDKRYPGKCYGAVFRIFTCDQTPEQHAKMIEWFQKTFQVTPKVAYSKKDDIYYPFLKFNTPDSLKLWGFIREHVLQHKSMKHKFRYMEYRYQYKSVTASTSQPKTGE